MSELKPVAVIEEFTRLTGIRFRFVPDGVQRQARAFIERGFALRDLEIVVLWIRRQIARNEGGFSPASLQWRVLFGDYGASDEMLKFQERLGLAEEAMRRGWRPRLASDGPAPLAKPAPAPAVPAPEKQEQLGRAIGEGLRRFREEMGGGR